MNYRYLMDLDTLPNCENVMIYGTGQSGQMLYKLLKAERPDVRLLGFIDSFTRGNLFDQQIYNVNDLSGSDICPHTAVLLASYNASWIDEMVENLLLLGFKNYWVNAMILNPMYRNLDLSQYQHDIEWVRDRIDDSDRNLFDILIDTLVGNSTYDLQRWYMKNKGDQYFDYISIKSGDVIIEGGVFDGGHTTRFADLVGEEGIVYGFDPFGDTIAKLWSRRTYTRNNLRIIKKALWSNSGHLYFSDDGAGSTVSNDPSHAKNKVEGISIDDFALAFPIKGLNMIKLDVEGAEERVLQGAIQTIKYYKPQMAISIYHKVSDFFHLPKLIDSVLPEARFMLMTYSPTPTDTILYVLP